MKDKEEVVTLDTSRPWVKARCPCGGVYMAGSSKELGQGFVMHSMPTCTPYVEYDVIEFLSHARMNGAFVLEKGPKD